MDKSTQDKATKFMLRFFKDAYDAKLPKPRITEDAFPACRDAVAGVTEDQMLAAMDQVRSTISASVVSATDSDFV